MKSGSIETANQKFLSEKSFEQYAQHELKQFDLVIATVGSHPSQKNSAAGRATIIPAHAEGMLLNQNAVCIRTNSERLDQRFLGFVGQSEKFQSYVANSGRGAASQMRIPLSAIRAYSFSLPAKSTQKRVIAILSAYDDLIENNRRRIALLEEAARMLYREWFVHFRFPGHEHVKIMDGLPEGWERRSIGSACSYLGRGISPAYDDDGEYFVVSQKCVRNRMFSLEPARRQKKEYREEKALKYRDILINSTGTGTLGRVAQCWLELEATTFDSHVTVARANDTVDPFWFGYALMELETVFEGMGEGATNQKELSKARIADVLLNVPPRSFQTLFSEFSASTSSQIQTLANQNQKLAQARDLLLPRLMNGEIAV